MGSTRRNPVPSLGRAAFVASIVVAVLVVASLAWGAGAVSPLDALRVLAGMSDDPDAQFVVSQLRWPRTLLGLVVGVCLGAAGAVLQAATRNPLAEPGLLGVSAGASFAVVLAIGLGAGAATLNLGVAILGAMVGCFLVLLVTQMRDVGDDPVRLVLAGAAFSGILMSLSSLILLYDQRTADEIRFWVIGALGGRPVEALVWSVAGTALGLMLLVPVLRPLAALALGENLATGLGHRPRVIR